MTSIEQREKLHANIWKMADEARGSIDGWDFKQFVLGTLFYRFISEAFANYLSDDEFDYAKASDDDISDELRRETIKEKGFFIKPSELFVNVVETAKGDDNLNEKLRQIFQNIENSAVGHASENDIKGLFDDFDTTSNRLGGDVMMRNRRLANLLENVKNLNFGLPGEMQIDLFGDAYEFLISNYAAHAGKSGGEFFTPQCVSRLVARLALSGQTEVNGVYDPACGSGSLLLQAWKAIGAKNLTGKDSLCGQEINMTTYNLARMNMFLHGVGYETFSIEHGDTLVDPKFGDRQFDAVVSNPPYSIHWVGDDNPKVSDDNRFRSTKRAPKTKADMAFVLDCLHHLSARGRAAIVCFPGILYRGGAEQEIRKHLVKNKNAVEAVIAMPENLFYGTSIATNILVLSKHKSDARTLFVDAGTDDFFKKEPRNNILTDEHADRVVALFERREPVPHVAALVDNSEIEANNFNLSVSTYVEPRDTREAVDIDALNAEIAKIVRRQQELRTELDAIVAKLEADEARG